MEDFALTAVGMLCLIVLSVWMVHDAKKESRRK